MFAVAALMGSLSVAADDPPLPKSAIVLRGHGENVYAIAFSPTGNQVATASFDKTIRLWDPATGKEVKSFGGPTGHTGLILAVAFHPAGHSMASGGADNFAKLWDVPSSNAFRDFAHADAVNGVALSPDGKLLASAGKDGTVKLWNPADGKPVSDLKGHTGAVQNVAFSNDSKTLASAGSDGSIRYWDIAKNAPIGMVGAHVGAANAILFHANNTQTISAGDDGALRYWQLPAPASRALTPHADLVTSIALSPDGNQVYSASADKTVRHSTFADGKQVKQFVGPNASVTCVAISPTGTLLAGGTGDNRVFLWNPADAKVVSNSVAHNGIVTTASFHPQGTQLLTGGADGALKLWSMPPLPTRSLAHADAVTAMALTPDAKRLITGSNDKIVRSWNLTNNAMERQFAGHTGVVTAVALSPNSQTLVSGGDDATIRFWNQANGSQTDLFAGHTGPITGLTFHPNSAQVLSSSADGTIKLWQLPAVPVKPFVHPDGLTLAVLSPDGNKLLTACNDKQTRLWNLANGQIERAFPAPPQPITALTFSPNGAVVAVASADKSVTVWNAADAKEVKKFPNLPAVVQSIAYGPDNNTIAAGLADNSIRLLDVAQGKETKNFAGHTGAVTTVLYSAKGDQVISGSADKTVQVWSIADGMSKLKIDHGAAVTSLGLSKDGLRILSGGADKSVKAWTLADGKPAATIATPAEVRSVGFSPDGNRVVVAGADNKARVFALDGKLMEFFNHEAAVFSAAYHGDGKRLVTASADKTAKLWTSALVWQGTHTGPVRDAAFSPKGDRILSGGDDKLVKVWNAADGKELKSFPGHGAAVTGISLSADATKVASASADKTIKVWLIDGPKPEPTASIALAAAPAGISLSPNGLRVAVGLTNQISVHDIATGKELQSISDHTAPVRAVAFAADNRTLVSASADKTARVSDVNAISVIDAHPGGVVGAQFHSNLTQVLSAGGDKTIKLWDLKDGKAVKTFGPLPDPITAVGFSRDFAQVGATTGKTFKSWNVADGKELPALAHPADVLSFSWSFDKARVATGATDNLTRVWDVATGTLLQTYRQEGAVRAVAYHNANTAVVSGSADKTIAVNPLSIVRAVPAAAGPIRSLAQTPNTAQVLTAADDKTVKAWNFNVVGKPERTFEGAEGPVHAVAVSKSGIFVAAAGADKKVRVYTFADGKQVGQPLAAPDVVRSLAYAPNNAFLAAACDKGPIGTWNVVFTPGQPLPAEFGKPLQTFSHAATAASILFAADSATFYTASHDKSLKAWRLASDQATKSIQHPNIVDSTAFDPSGNQLATGCHDGILRIWDLTKAPPVATKAINAHLVPNMPAAPIYSVTWTADGKQVLSTSLDRTLKLWDVASGNLVREFKAYKEKEFDKGHQEGVFSAAFSPDGKFIVSGGSDKSIKIWNVADGTVVREFTNPQFVKPDAPVVAGQPVQAHPGWVYGVRFVKDGKYVVSAGPAPGNKGYLAVWNVADGKLLYGEALPVGAINNLAISPDGTVLGIACGPQTRMATEVNSFLLKMPDVVK